MKCLANVTFLGLRSNVSKKNGQIYYNVDVRSDGRNMSFGTRCPDAFTGFKEYQQITITIDLFNWNNSLIGNVTDALAVKKGD